MKNFELMNELGKRPAGEEIFVWNSEISAVVVVDVNDGGIEVETMEVFIEGFEDCIPLENLVDCYKENYEQNEDDE